MTQLGPLSIYVVGIHNSDDEHASKYEAAYGIYYDSAKFFNHNDFGQARKIVEEECGDDEALYDGILYAIRDAPRGYDLIIESEVKWLVAQINRAIQRRRADPTIKGKKRLENEWETPIIDLIEFRTKRGDCFVDIVYSGKDVNSKRGFTQAKGLARKALTPSRT